MIIYGILTLTFKIKNISNEPNKQKQ